MLLLTMLIQITLQKRAGNWVAMIVRYYEHTGDWVAMVLLWTLSVMVASVCVMARLCACTHVCVCVCGSQVAEQLGNRAGNQKVAGSLPGRAK